MKVKTADLIDLPLDWAVTVADGLKPTMRHDYMRAKAAANNYKGDLAWHLEVTPNDPITVDEAGVTRVLRAYSGQWSQGGPIIEREGISTRQVADGTWRADFSRAVLKAYGSAYAFLQKAGPTPLVAAMRCLVASRLGDEVEVPDELMK